MTPFLRGLSLALIALLPQSLEARTSRSSAAVKQFEKLYPCPALGPGTCFEKGYVVDHRTPLKCGGRDHPDNMQWQSVEEAKAKDKWELKACQKK